ncbi:MFS transporter [Hufsiella ginkgonis]|uniref:MFS transporter n=1 Tax=Hufsiella ginkgonis TaxID=2695274 RepID=A0A7K1XZF5_9SPHI|nr:MFS transporter [Hufsiella ginkgonis]MXV16188.1 MFS transporter [Hufsiella ginkgonis]
MSQKNDKKTIRAWAMFDWANSAYNLVITSTVFPAYYTEITSTPEHGDKVSFFGFTFVNTALANYSLAFAYLVMAVSLPVLSSIADFRGNKKTFMMAFTYIGSLACCGLFFFDLDTLELGIILSAVAAMGYIGGVAFNNSYLPEIATVDEQDKASARGFAYGYIGSVVLQIICFVFIQSPGTFGLSTQKAVQLSFLLVGLWWIGFSQIPFRKLHSGGQNRGAVNHKVIHSGFQELAKVWKQISGMAVLKRFLLAFFFYAMGVQTIMLVAAAFGAKVLHLPQDSLIKTVLVIQLVAILGAYFMSRFALKYGNIRVLICVVVVWMGACVGAYYTTTANQFYALAVVVGLIMGGIQSLSRSTYSKFLPENTPDTTSFFSFYDVTEKIAIVIGLFTFGYMESVTDNMRNSALALVIFFLIGLVILVSMLKMKERKDY